MLFRCPTSCLVLLRADWRHCGPRPSKMDFWDAAEPQVETGSSSQSVSLSNIVGNIGDRENTQLH